MRNPLSRIATRVAYGASQLPRVAWYVGHSLAMRRLVEEARRAMVGPLGDVLIPMRILPPVRFD
ncbi:MAG: hypothetical protein WB540_06775 [Pseudolabrys sp.]|jgi:hypothetical protein